MQVLLTTARLYGFKGSKEDLKKPENNFKYAAKVLRDCMDAHECNLKMTLMCYNGGLIAEQGTRKREKTEAYARKASRGYEGNLRNYCYGGRHEPIQMEHLHRNRKIGMVYREDRHDHANMEANFSGLWLHLFL